MTQYNTNKHPLVIRYPNQHPLNMNDHPTAIWQLDRQTQVDQREAPHHQATQHRIIIIVKALGPRHTQGIHPRRVHCFLRRRCGGGNHLGLHPVGNILCLFSFIAIVIVIVVVNVIDLSVQQSANSWSTYDPSDHGCINSRYPFIVIGGRFDLARRASYKGWQWNTVEQLHVSLSWVCRTGMSSF